MLFHNLEKERATHLESTLKYRISDITSLPQKRVPKNAHKKNFVANNLSKEMQNSF